MPHALYILFLFMLGACVGSFLNVVVHRLPEATSIWDGLKRLTYPPSQSPKCGHKLAWYDNIPVLGWIMLGGKCRYCRTPISPRYPIIEAVTGGLFALYYVALFMLELG